MRDDASAAALLPVPIEMSARLLVLGGREAPAQAALASQLALHILDAVEPLFVLDLRDDLLVANATYLDLFALAADNRAAVDAHIARLKTELAPIRKDLGRRAERLTSQQNFARDGRTAHFRVAFFPILDAAGTLSAIGGTYTDITQQVAATTRLARLERSYQDVLRSSSDWAWEVDASGRLSFLSERVTEVLGRPPALLIGQVFAELTHGNDALTLARLISDDRRPFRNLRVELIDRDGRRRVQSLNGVPVFEPQSGRYAGFRGTGTDVTKEVEAEERSREARHRLETALADLNRKNTDLDRALDRAQAAARAKSAFLANMSHELRTPLNAIIGFADVIRSQTLGADPTRYSEYAGYILKAGYHLLTLINDVLDLSQVEADALKVQMAPTELQPVVDEAVALVAERAVAKRLALEGINLASNPVVLVDRTRLLQIVLNLLTNAIKFTPEGGVVRLDLKVNDKRAMLAVEDSGPGIPENRQADIFEAFIQIHELAHTRPHEGAGLGLSIARRLARLMQGDVIVESTPGSGARFTISMLVIQPDASTEQAQEDAAMMI